MCDGERWRQVRSRVTPLFTSGNMVMFYLIEACGQKLSDYLNVASVDGKRVHRYRILLHALEIIDLKLWDKINQQRECTLLLLKMFTLIFS